MVYQNGIIRETPTDEEVIASIRSFVEIKSFGGILFGGFVRKVLVPATFNLDDPVDVSKSYDWEGEQTLLLEAVREYNFDLDVWFKSHDIFMGFLDEMNDNPTILLRYVGAKGGRKYPFTTHTYTMAHKESMKFICCVDFVISEFFQANDLDISALVYYNDIFLTCPQQVGYGSVAKELVPHKPSADTVSVYIKSILEKRATILPTFHMVSEGKLSPKGFDGKKIRKKAEARIQKYKDEGFELEIHTYEDAMYPPRDKTEDSDEVLEAMWTVTRRHGKDEENIAYVCGNDIYFRVDPTDHPVFVGSGGINYKVKDIITAKNTIV